MYENFSLIKNNLMQNAYLYFIFFIGLMVIINYFYKIKYFSITELIGFHWSIYKNDDNKIPKIILFNLIVIPFIISVGLAIITPVNDGNILEKTLVVFSIFISMLFTILAILINFAFQKKEDVVEQTEKDLRVLVKETYYTIMYEILKAISIVLMCFINSFFTSDIKVNLIYSIIFYYLIITFILNLGTVMRRIFRIFEHKL